VRIAAPGSWGAENRLYQPDCRPSRLTPRRDPESGQIREIGGGALPSTAAQVRGTVKGERDVEYTVSAQAGQTRAARRG
jgi:hypothetical protein